jgi:hypothetical protein
VRNGRDIEGVGGRGYSQLGEYKWETQFEMDEEGKATPLWRMTICGEGQKREIGLGHDEKICAKHFFHRGHLADTVAPNGRV